MALPQTAGTGTRRTLRLWPGVVAVTLLWLVKLLVPVVVPAAAGIAILAGLAGGLTVVVWWLFFSRAPWVERLGAIALMVLALVAISRVVHESIATGMMGFMLPFFSLPIFSLVLVGWAVASRHLAAPARWGWLVVAIILVCAGFTLVRTGGLSGDGDADLHWRWTLTPEERLLAQTDAVPDAVPAAPPTPKTADEPSPDRARGEPTAPMTPPAATETFERPAPAPVAEDASRHTADPSRGTIAADWPGFRGPARDGIVRGVEIETDWSTSPPVELWRRPVGPGWSSFAVRGDLFYTQEQRGDDEIVASYRMSTGEPVWRHRDAARFWESNAGAGPRGTPTVSNGRVYALGATGILNALDARNGSVLWTRNAASDTASAIPDWGIASSPLVLDDLVVVAAAGALAAYDVDTGHPRWFGPPGGWGYSSPHFAVIDGVGQIVLVNGPGAIGIMPSDGTALWQHSWAGDSIVQPAVLAGGDLLIGSGSGLAAKTGTIRLALAREAGGWAVKERWMSTGLKPYFNDFVVHEGHAFGFDGGILSCIDVEDGTRKWKGGRYGYGQLVLLPEQDVLLVLSEQGELALVQATPDKHTELARFPALEGKTWNHPVLAGNVLLVRNAEQMVAFRLVLAPR
jgi:outer membrane protein assembly factor BamB